MQLTLALVACLAVAHAYPTGPPLEACQDMFPTGHNMTQQTTTAPFKVKVSRTCFQAGTTIRVSIQSEKSEADGGKFFEGFLAQARKMPDVQSSTGVGTFTKTDPELRTMDCFGQTKSAISQGIHKHYFCKEFTWTAPAKLLEDIIFTTTIVHETDTFWLDVRSPKLMYNATCDSAAPTEMMCKQTPTGGAREMSAATLTLGALVLLAIVID